MVENGDHEQAHDALDNLLELGPKNIEALKLKTVLYANEGRFVDERMLWEKIIFHDNEDLDAIFFFQRRHFEERESFYFTDRLPDGGVRFMANPKALISSSMLGLLGCTLFLILNSYSQKYYILSSHWISMSIFLMFVILPWISIVFNFVRSLKDVVLDLEGIKFYSRMKVVSMLWSDIDHAYLIYGIEEGEQKLCLVLTPKDPKEKAIEIDLGAETTSVRARAYFLDEFCRFYRPPTHLRIDALTAKFPGRLKF